jgi:hypothetical protein
MCLSAIVPIQSDGACQTGLAELSIPETDYKHSSAGDQHQLTSRYPKSQEPRDVREHHAIQMLTVEMAVATFNIPHSTK